MLCVARPRGTWRSRGKLTSRTASTCTPCATHCGADRGAGRSTTDVRRLASGSTSRWLQPRPVHPARTPDGQTVRTRWQDADGREHGGTARETLSRRHRHRRVDLQGARGRRPGRCPAPTVASRSGPPACSRSPARRRHGPGADEIHHPHIAETGTSTMSSSTTACRPRPTSTSTTGSWSSPPPRLVRLPAFAVPRGVERPHRTRAYPRRRGLPTCRGQRRLHLRQPELRQRFDEGTDAGPVVPTRHLPRRLLRLSRSGCGHHLVRSPLIRR